MRSMTARGARGRSTDRHRRDRPTRPQNDMTRGDRHDDTERPTATSPGSSLPSGRAAVGALLVAIAALLTFAAYLRASGPARGRFLVLTHDLAAGDSVAAADVRTARVDIPKDIAQQLVDPATSLDGVVTLSPLRAGQFLQAGDLIRKPAGASSREISLAVDSAMAAGGRLVPGDRVDLLATFGSGSDASTKVVLSDAPVVRVDRGESSITSTRGSMTITLAFDDPSIEPELAQALAIAKVQLIRSTGAGRAAPRPS